MAYISVTVLTRAVRVGANVVTVLGLVGGAPGDAWVLLVSLQAASHEILKIFQLEPVGGTAAAIHSLTLETTARGSHR